jgi:hypothetical protein
MNLLSGVHKKNIMMRIKIRTSVGGGVFIVCDVAWEGVIVDDVCSCGRKRSVVSRWSRKKKKGVYVFLPIQTLLPALKVHLSSEDVFATFFVGCLASGCRSFGFLPQTSSDAGMFGE